MWQTHPETDKEWPERPKEKPGGLTGSPICWFLKMGTAFRAR